MAEDPANWQRRVVILGDGVAGSMTAAALARSLSPARYDIRLVATGAPDDSVGAFGPTETAPPSLSEFHLSLGLDENALLRETSGSFALGVAYSGWSDASPTYFTGFGEAGAPLDGIPFHQLAARLRASGRTLRLADYSLTALAAQMGRFARPADDPRSVLSSYGYGLHLPRDAYARALAGAAETRGVRRVGEAFQAAELDESGGVAALRLERGTRVEGDFFVDCSGPRALLIGQALGTGFESWRSWLPCDRAIETFSPSAVPPSPYSHFEAHTAGWRRTVPVQDGVAQAFVYASEWMTESELPAVEFEAGRRSSAWKRNCVGLGAAAATLEPFDSIPMLLVQAGLRRLLKLFPTGTDCAAEAAEYNRQSSDELERLRDYVILRYKTNGCRGQPFWDRQREMPVPAPLSRKLALYRSRGRISLEDGDRFEEADWATLLDDQGIRQRRYDVRAEAVPMERLERHLGRLREVMIEAAATLPLHRDYIAAQCRAERVKSQ